MLAVLRQRLMQGITQTHEKLARDSIFEWAEFKFLNDGTKWASSTADFSTLSASATYQMDIKFIEDVRLRLVERSLEYLQEFGTYAQPVPGAAFARDALVLTTPHVLYDIWNRTDNTWIEELHGLQDARVINGGMFRYRGMVFAENRMGVLWNAGEITHQCRVTSPISWGDGAPDPDSSTVHNVYYVGQSTDDITHYIQCDDVGTSEFQQGDRVTIHTTTTTDYGITGGVDPFHGKTYDAVVYSVNESTHRITFTQPLTEEYTVSDTLEPQSTTDGLGYAYVTKARHIHPTVIMAQRGVHTFASRTKIRVHNPTDDNVDLPGIVRVSWDEYGQMNRWNPFAYEVMYGVASDTRSGYDAVSLR